MPKGKKWRSRRDKLQEKVWNETHERIKAVCLGEGRFPSIRDLAEKTGFSKRIVQKHISLIKDEFTQERIVDEIQIKKIKSQTSLDNKFDVFFVEPGRSSVKIKEKTLVIEKKASEDTGVWQQLRKLIIDFYLQNVYLSRVFEAPIHDEKVRLFWQCYEDDKTVSDAGFESLARQLIPKGQAMVVYSFDTELLIDNLKTTWKETTKAEEEVIQQEKEDLERYLQREQRKKKNSIGLSEALSRIQPLD